jgi:hypothetical protein
MLGGVTFAEVLAQEMAGFLPRGPVSAPKPPPTYGFVPPHPFLFSKPILQFRAPAYSSMGTRTSSVSYVPPPVVMPPLVPRKPRKLTVRQRRALNELVALGANLGSDFTARELRSAYRTLARQYHPDRHPASTEIEKARLARMFADVNENHRRLVVLLDESAPPARS